MTLHETPELSGVGPVGMHTFYGGIGGGHSDPLRMVKGVLIWACVHKEERVFN